MNDEQDDQPVDTARTDGPLLLGVAANSINQDGSERLSPSMDMASSVSQADPLTFSSLQKDSKKQQMSLAQHLHIYKEDKEKRQSQAISENIKVDPQFIKLQFPQESGTSQKLTLGGNQSLGKQSLADIQSVNSQILGTSPDALRSQTGMLSGIRSVFEAKLFQQNLSNQKDRPIDVDDVSEVSERRSTNREEDEDAGISPGLVRSRKKSDGSPDDNDDMQDELMNYVDALQKEEEELRLTAAKNQKVPILKHTSPQSPKARNKNKVRFVTEQPGRQLTLERGNLNQGNDELSPLPDLSRLIKQKSTPLYGPGDQSPTRSVIQRQSSIARQFTSGQQGAKGGPASQSAFEEEEQEHQTAQLNTKLFTATEEIQYGFYMMSPKKKSESNGGGSSQKNHLDLFIAITKSKQSSMYRLELFKSDGFKSFESDAIDFEDLMQTDLEVEFQVRHTCRRQISVILAIERHRSGFLIQNQTVFILYSKKFAWDKLSTAQPALDQNSQGFMRNGIIKVPSEYLPECPDPTCSVYPLVHTNEEKMIRMFSLAYQVVCEDSNFQSQLNDYRTTRITRSTDTNPNLATSIYHIDMRDILEKMAIPETAAANGSQLDGQEAIYVPGRENIAKKIIGCFQFKTVDQFYSLCYEDGRFDCVKYKNKVKSELLATPANDKFINCCNTIFEEKPLVLLQDRSYIYGFQCRGRKGWCKIYMIETDQYDIIVAMTRFIFANNRKTNQLFLLEAGQDQFKTECPVRFDIGENQACRVDALEYKSDFGIIWRPKCQQFKWLSFTSHEYFHFMDNKRVNQICDKYIVELQMGRCLKLGLYDIEGFQPDSASRKFVLRVPDTISNQSRVKSFLPKLSPCGKILICAISYQGADLRSYENEQYQALLLLDLDKKKRKFSAKELTDKESFERFCFLSSNCILIYSRQGIVRTKIKPAPLGSDEMGVQFADVVEDEVIIRFPVTTIHPFCVRQGSLWLFCRVEDKIMTLSDVENMEPIKYPELEKDELEQNINMLVLQHSEYVRNINKQACNQRALLTLPDNEAKNQQSKSCRCWQGCLSDDEKSIFIMYSNYLVAWVYIYEFENDSEEEISLKRSSNNKQDPILVTLQGATDIKYLNKHQVVLQSINGFCIVNIALRQLIFKFVFAGYLNFDLTISRNAIAIPRRKNGVIINIGDLEQAQTNYSNRPEHMVYNDLNHVYVKFNDLFFNITKGYLSIEELSFKWDTRLCPIKINRNDHIIRDKDNHNVITDFKEYTIVTHTYYTSFNIMEATIRSSLIDQTMPIQDSQIDRILNPVLSDNNKSVLHHICSRSLPLLVQLFSKTNISGYVDASEKRFPFFLDFYQKSPLHYAIEHFDTESLRYLICQLITHQNYYFSAYLLDEWIITALKQDIDLRPLFESKLCTCNLHDSEFDGSKSFPEFGTETQTETRKFNLTMEKLVFSNNLYKEVFTDSEDVKNTAGDVLQPITFDVDFFFLRSGCQDPVERRKKKIALQKEFIRVLAKKQDTSLFQTKYIQRFINFHWRNGHRGVLKLNFSLHVFIMVFILTCSVLTRYENGTSEAQARRIILCVNIVPILYVLSYEIKQMTTQKCKYFQSSKNLGDVTFLLIFVLTLYFDLAHGSTPQDSEDFYEVTRILYACLCPLGFIKLLDSMRTFNAVSFIVRMIYSVIHGLVPFLLLYFFVILVSMFAQRTLGLEFKPDPEEGDTAYTAGIGFLAYFFFVVRTSLGDFDVEPYAELPRASQFVIWTIWLLTVFGNTIIFLNFLIAVITDVYEQIMSTRTEEIFLKKAELLLEINEIVGDRAMADNVSSIYITRSAKEADKQDEWSGFFNELKSHITHKSDRLEATITTQTNQLAKQFADHHKDTTQGLMRVEKLFDRLSQSLEKHTELVIAQEENTAIDRQSMGLPLRSSLKRRPHSYERN